MYTEYKEDYLHNSRLHYNSAFMIHRNATRFMIYCKMSDGEFKVG